MTNRKKDILISGLALFAIFFGAGNLIFPPYLGVITGDGWLATMVGFLLADPVIPILTVIVTAAAGGKAVDIGKRVGDKFAKILTLAAIICIGPAFAIPRTAATTYEVGFQSFFPNLPIWVVTLVFFAITFALAFKESNVVNIIGKYITPALLVFLFIVIVKAIISPIGKPIDIPVEGGYFVKGFYEGYQTLDAFASPLFTGIVVADLMRKGYGKVNRKDRLSFIVSVGIVASIFLSLVYGGLTYLGASGSSIFTADDSRVEILVSLIYMTLGNFGKFALSVCVTLACLTTAIGLTSSAGNFIEELTHGKVKYIYTVIVVTIISFLLSSLGVDAIINLAVPVLTIGYPIIIALVFYMMFDKKVPYNMAYILMVVGVTIVAVIETFGEQLGLGALVEIIKSLPLAQFGFTWFIPSLVCFVIGWILGKFGLGKKVN
ncbi:branched-chain amino acid transport system II carrier protein [Anaerococcus prevotii]|uniref:Branched-chain amino acid transport system carrier protein n=1 Tax=Anaerococcus prevotii ACS-065-V-Col13 TaxID=879305 RepID=F0GVK2_9FIRM|nr:branched-chain amino acid transport system II carrier protein [Anaerococcus prevotii]EGC82171.1 branched-chain amino acid transport system II carrier protein [Anaerococcus prevotii ACS-065-V-Col13]